MQVIGNGRATRATLLRSFFRLLVSIHKQVAIPAYPKTSEPLPATSQVPSGTKDVSPARSIQSTFPNAEFRDITLVEAKTISLKTLRESVGFSMPERDEIDRIKDEQNLLKSVEDKYWDLWAAYKAYDAYKKEVEAVLNCWRVACSRQRAEDAKKSESLARLWEHSRHQLHASLNGSETPPKVRGLRQAELIFREALGLKVDGTMLRPTDMPNLNSMQLDWLELKIYESRLKDKVGDQDGLLDNIARAHQRRAQAETQHHEAAREYNKALTNMKYLCSQLTVGAEGSQK